MRPTTPATWLVRTADESAQLKPYDGIHAPPGEDHMWPSRAEVLAQRLRDYGTERGWRIDPRQIGDAIRLTVESPLGRALVEITRDGAMFVFGDPTPLQADLMIWKALHASAPAVRALK